ncbi:glycosyltransferase [Ferruginibacter lapsinanis]|uniref:glycosyltransferase n=1 Tax=Ferruginibacter lapsinanis TaxID=563172 RepID=UPI001E45C9EF|nr:glycosyltransferase [Ferruginibacter lapsinanis]UEG50556.1 glycosyltransferase [Ferruginibacter lapsinanis]
MSTCKKILFISYDGMTDSLGQSQVLPYVIGLTEYGYEFVILSCEKPDKYEKTKQLILNIIKDHPITWHPLQYHKNPPIISTLYDYYNLRTTAKKLHEQHKFDMVHHRNGILMLVALWLNKNLGLPYLNDIRGFWADERADGGLWNLKNPLYNFIYKFFKKQETKCILNAGFNVCLTNAAKKEIHSWNLPGQPLPVEVIPCSTDLNLFNPDNIDQTLREKLAHELAIGKTDYIISYLGSIGLWYMTDEMMLFCKQLIDKIPNAKFLFISHNKDEEIIALAEKYQFPLSRLIIKHGQRDEIPALLSFSDISIFFIKPCFSKKSSSPTKHGEIMSMGIPLITNSGVGDVDEIVVKYDSGYILSELTSNEFESVIQKIISKKSFDKQKIRLGAIDYYSLTTAVKKYNEVYKKILK